MADQEEAPVPPAPEQSTEEPSKDPEAPAPVQSTEEPSTEPQAPAPEQSTEEPKAPAPEQSTEEPVKEPEAPAPEQSTEEPSTEPQAPAPEQSTEEPKAPAPEQSTEEPVKEPEAPAPEQTTEEPVKEPEAPAPEQSTEEPVKEPEAPAPEQSTEEPSKDSEQVPAPGEPQETIPDANPPQENENQEETKPEEAEKTGEGEQEKQEQDLAGGDDKPQEPVQEKTEEQAETTEKPEVLEQKEGETQEEKKEDDKVEDESKLKAESAPVPAPTPVIDQVPGDATPRTTANLEATATVKFVLMPSGQVVTLACTLGQTLTQLKDHFAQELKLPVNLILVMFEGKGIDDNTTLADLGVGPNGTIQLEMQSADPVNTPIKTYRPRQEYHMPDVITVRVQTEEGTFKDVVVEIERATRKKPYLGGFKHKKTTVEYHNASAQTTKKLPPPSSLPKHCRDTQTVEQRHRVQQTQNDTSTQMTKIGVYVSNMPDKLATPGKYITADEFHYSILMKVITIQKYYRRWLAKRYVQKLKDDHKQREEWERQEEIRKRKEKEERIRREFERRMNPKSKEDFDLLYHALEKWRQEELERINGSADGAERKAALCMLLDQETQLISAIGRHKLEADGENKDKRIQNFLNKAAAPKKWKGFDGKATEMDTPYTIRAKELRDIYNSINMKYLTQDERLDVLLTLKHTVKEHDCKLTQEIIELIDREADLLMRGVKEGNLDGLRKRISTLFLQYIKTPTFNPEAAKLLKVPQDPSILRQNIYFCPSCNQYLSSTEFTLSSNSRTVGKCRRCAKIDNDARTRQDFSTYRHMLKALRRNEESYGDASKIAFLLQEQDLRYLVEKIWSSQSVLSAWEDLYDLVLVRWDKHQEWSPWNCVLLTKDEAAAHEKLVDLEEGYGHIFIHKVQQKHTLARNYFSRLPGMAEHIRYKANEKPMVNGPAVAGQQVPVQQRA